MMKTDNSDERKRKEYRNRLFGFSDIQIEMEFFKLCSGKWVRGKWMKFEVILAEVLERGMELDFDFYTKADNRDLARNRYEFMLELDQIALEYEITFR